MSSQTDQPSGDIRLLLVEDNFYTRLGTAAFLRGQPGIQVVGQAEDGDCALTLFAQLAPDVTVVDLRMPRMDGVQLIGALRARAPEARILVLTHYQGDENIFQALKAGASGYLTKETPGEELLAAVRAVAAGQRFFPPEIAQRIASAATRPQLTRREQQVLEQIADGASNRETAASLGISDRTVGLYVSSILSKLGARSRTEAVSIAVHRGILQSGPE
jgi:DNA-binding NarL/FixJ family response regulator